MIIKNNKNLTSKKICIQFKAIKPSIGGRYAAGQFRCNTCDIYLIAEGVNANSCKCCNMRIRTKPRNGFYKQKYYEKIQNTQQPEIRINNINKIKELKNELK